MPHNNISKAQPSKAKGLGGVLTIRSKNAALLLYFEFVTVQHIVIVLFVATVTSQQ